MFRFPPKVIAIVAVVMMAIGAALTMAFAVAESSCDASAGSSGTVIVPHSTHCSGDVWAAGVGYGVLILGAILLVLAVIGTTTRFSSRRVSADSAPPGE